MRDPSKKLSDDRQRAIDQILAINHKRWALRNKVQTATMGLTLLDRKRRVIAARLIKLTRQIRGEEPDAALDQREVDVLTASVADQDFFDRHGHRPGDEVAKLRCPECARDRAFVTQMKDRYEKGDKE